MEPAPDFEGLLVALTLAPGTFSRNRFFDLYTDPAARRVHRRAKLLRNVVQHLGSPSGPRGVTITHHEEGRALLAYTVPALGLTRTVPLDPLELVVIRFALGRGARDAAPDVLAALGPDPSDGPRIQEALSRLLPRPCYEEASDPS
ncbi:MAG TPA: hypothetical protein VLS89_14965 [Candidatus Nanopelagicales bacterium]|nr:hypothetical protein [Candidatus Nanopelagicales bacterium]